MPVVIKVKKSETALSKPTASDIAVGEVALNAKDQRIFVRDANGDIITVGEAGGIRHESSAVTFTVTVATKDATHRYNGSGSSSGYKIDGSFSPTLILAPGNTYKFDQADSSNSGHPLLFYYESAKTTAYSTGVTTSGTPGSSGAYTQIVVSDATPLVLHYQCSSHGLMGNQIVTNTRNYTGVDTDDISEGSSNLYFTNARADARITNALKDEDNMASDSATHVASQQSVKAYVDAQVATKDNSDEITEGSTNLYFTNARADARITNALVDEDNMASDSATKVPSQQSVKAYVDASAGSSLTVQEEGSSLSTAATTLNFVGSGVTASGTGATKTITVSGGGGSSTGNTTDITQSSHGLAAKDAIRHNGSSWVKAQADDNSTLALGIVTAVADSNTFTVAQAGRFTISSHGLTVGQWYYLSSSSAGGLTATEPTISQPIVYVESASVIFVYPYRPTNLLLDGSSGVTPGDNTVTSAKIVDGTIVTADLADDAVTSAKIADDAITSALIADDAITSALIADDAITSALIADDAVVQAAIADDAVNEARLQVSNTPTNGYFLSAQSGNTGGLTWAEAISGTSWDMTVKTANFTAVAGNGYLVNTTGGAFTVTLPASPSNGDIVEIKDVAGTADTNNISIARNGSKINGENVTKKLHDERITVTLLFTGSTYGWVTIGDSNNTTSPWNTETVAVEFLTLAGGGAGGKGGGGAGGGGAGGYIASTSASIDKGVAYTVTVGAGGAGSTSATAYGGDGGNSSFGGTTATGGGAGSNGGENSSYYNGKDGGSGGGATYSGGDGTSGQGNDGGDGASPNGGDFNRSGGGGGGAGGAGGNSGGSYNPGAGGSGSASSITGSSVTRAGGGGGSLYGYFGNNTGAAGSGGGGIGGSNNTDGTAGTANTGGGGGASCYQYNPYDANNGTNGGSGIVIIKVLTSLYSGTTSGSPTVTTSGSHTILQYTSSGTYTA